MPAWNIIVTTKGREYVRARQLLERFGEVTRVDFHNVLVMRVDDVPSFITSFAERYNEDPRLEECLSRVLPLAITFDFEDTAEFEAKAREAALTFVPQLAGKSFHVRLKRRGLKGELSSMDEEQFLDETLLTALEREGAPGRITFDDPDAILDVETLEHRAGLSLWKRDELQAYSFLKVH